MENNSKDRERVEAGEKFVSHGIFLLRKRTKPVKATLTNWAPASAVFPVHCGELLSSHPGPLQMQLLQPPWHVTGWPSTAVLSAQGSGGRVSSGPDSSTCHLWTLLEITRPLSGAEVFSGGLVGKESACNVRHPGSTPGSGRSPGEGNGNPLRYSCLENSTDRGAWWATVHGVTKSWARLSGSHFLTHSKG